MRTRPSLHALATLALVPAAMILSLTVAPAAYASLAAVTTAPLAKQPVCTIVGTSGDDVLVGTAGRDLICGKAGNDTIRGLGGDDIIFGGQGDDRIDGGAGKDGIYAGGGDDIVSGGEGDDGLFGGNGEDVLDGGAGDDTVNHDKPLKDNPAWEVHMQMNFDLPVGTKVSFTYDRPSGNCITRWADWTSTVGDGNTHIVTVFQTVHANPWESCAWEKSYGNWTVKAVSPDGTTRTGTLRVSTGSPNIVDHFAEAVCWEFPKTLTCHGGSDHALVPTHKVPTPVILIGPMDIPPPAPIAPLLSCTGPTTFAVGQVWNETNAHLCSIDGYPRPDLRFGNLPPGITAARWPTATDGWIVFTGTVTAPWTGYINVTATLPSGWRADGGLEVYVK